MRRKIAVLMDKGWVRPDAKGQLFLTELLTFAFRDFNYELTDDFLDVAHQILNRCQKGSQPKPREHCKRDRSSMDSAEGFRYHWRSSEQDQKGRRGPPLEAVSEHHRIVGFRNILIHGYDMVDDMIVWNTIEAHLLVLMEEVRTLLDTAV